MVRRLGSHGQPYTAAVRHAFPWVGTGQGSHRSDASIILLSAINAHANVSYQKRAKAQIAKREQNVGS